MGLGDADLAGEGDGGGCKAAVPCSICLEAVSDNGDRSWAKLQCGHQFHLDCIGSAFNVKGAMQCPNCRKIEKGQWLYANGSSRPLPELIDEWPYDVDLYDLLLFGVHWCPFSGLTRLPSSFDEGDFSSSRYHDHVGYHTVFTEPSPVSSTTHPCPYITYFGPMHPSSTTSSASVSDGSNYSNHWTGASVPSEVPNSYTYPTMNVHYRSWDHSSPFTPSSRIGGADQTLITTPMTQRTARNTSDTPRTGMHPFLPAHSSAGRAPSSATSTVHPPYPGTVARSRDRPSLAYYQQSTSNPSARNSGRRPSIHSHSYRGLPQAAPIASSSEQSGGFYYLSSTSSGRNFHEVENPQRDLYNRPSFPSSQVDRDSMWGPFHPPAAASETGSRPNNFRQRQNRS